jgi:hypothetical protein
MVGVPSGSASNVMDAAAVAKRVVQGTPQCIGHESQGIEKVALSGAIGAHQKSQGLKAYITNGDALVVPDPNAAEKRWIVHRCFPDDWRSHILSVP